MSEPSSLFFFGSVLFAVAAIRIRMSRRWWVRKTRPDEAANDVTTTPQKAG
jgi:hypothetical protein